ncbi:MAG TPA: SCO1664 family protein [Methylomirabilota bacterium]|jgi:uncharacterized repeat protein (TIGR03843 family)
MATAETLAFLARGEITIKGRLPRASNATFLVEVTADGLKALAVYKPGRGERPLWDFPPCLYRREVAAYLLSEALGWGLVPPTLEREGPLGPGSLQAFIAADFEQHYFTLRDDPRRHDLLRKVCAFDLVANNADRKSGHCLLGPDGGIYAVDNGLTFHVEPKLRTVIWDFGGKVIPRPILKDLKRLVARGLPEKLAALLDDEEREAVLVRALGMVEAGRFPSYPGGFSLPWPPV